MVDPILNKLSIKIIIYAGHYFILIVLISSASVYKNNEQLLWVQSEWYL